MKKLLLLSATILLLASCSKQNDAFVSPRFPDRPLSIVVTDSTYGGNKLEIKLPIGTTLLVITQTGGAAPAYPDSESGFGSEPGTPYFNYVWTRDWTMQTSGTRSMSFKAWPSGETAVYTFTH